jgi:hypothetical protein
MPTPMATVGWVCNSRCAQNGQTERALLPGLNSQSVAISRGRRAPEAFLRGAQSSDTSFACQDRQTARRCHSMRVQLERRCKVFIQLHFIETQVSKAKSPSIEFECPN